MFVLGMPAVWRGCGCGGSFHPGVPVAMGGLGLGGRGAGDGRVWRGGYAGALQECWRLLKLNSYFLQCVWPLAPYDITQARWQQHWYMFNHSFRMQVGAPSIFIHVDIWDSQLKITP